MMASVVTGSRVSVDGKFFCLGGRKFYVKGVTYGPLAPNSRGEAFASPAQTELDLIQIKQLGANVLRIYDAPPPWLLDLARHYELKVLVDIPWLKTVCFLESASLREEARSAVRRVAEACARHPAVLALSVVNEVAPDVARWSGPAAVAAFIDELVGIVKSIDPACLCTFGNFPPTEFLRPREIDFCCFNVYLHSRKVFDNYLARLQMIAHTKPLLLGEFGLDSLREGELEQAEVLATQIQAAARAGLAGTILYSFTDEWYKDGEHVTDWQFGLTRRDRQPKPSFQSVAAAFKATPYIPLPRYPSVSIVVACYNGALTLKTCLESLARINYPAFELIVVDDGSSDTTAQIAAEFKSVRLIRHATNLGLSAARNTGIQAAQGELIAFTDADCRADEDWLYYLVGDLVNSRFVGVGGHNLLPPEDSWVAAAVMASPGGPAHVMLTDRLAEHIPGCNMLFYRWALEAISGFDPIFRCAGDDVDLCWRLQQQGLKIGFSSAGFVWHYRRSTVGAYLKQQHGYGEAEALLRHKHPEYFNWFGGGMWRGHIYSTAKPSLILHRSRIYYGPFASGFFQTLYAGQPEPAVTFFGSVEYYALVVFPLWILAVTFHFLIWPASLLLLIPIVFSISEAAQAELPHKKARFFSRPLIAFLFYVQPVVRGWARYRGRLSHHPKPLLERESLDSLSLVNQTTRLGETQYWVETGLDRLGFLGRIRARLDEHGWQSKPDLGWENYDVEIIGNRWSRLQLTTVAEAHRGAKTLIRCRLRPAWTFLARTVFSATLGVELVCIGLWGAGNPWHWLVLLSLIPLAGWLRMQGRSLQRLIAVFLDEIAKEFNLTKVGPSPERPRTPVIPPSSGS